MPYSVPRKAPFGADGSIMVSQVHSQILTNNMFLAHAWRVTISPHAVRIKAAWANPWHSEQGLGSHNYAGKCEYFYMELMKHISASCSAAVILI